MRFQPFLSLPLLFAVFILQNTESHTATLKLNSGPPAAAAVVELFTSEGCSSCPPADALLREIHGKYAPTGQFIIGISEHVTYWNRLGWKDPYSSEVFTDRQNAYASRLSVDGPYTPQMVVNGRKEFVGSDSITLRQALRQDLRETHIQLQILSATLSEKKLDLRFALRNATTQEPLDIIAVLTDDTVQSKVLRGENSGKSLQHISVARILSRVAVTMGNAEQSTYLSIPEDFHIAGNSGHHLVLFAQKQHQGAILGATITSF